MEVRESSAIRLVYSNQDFVDDVCRPNILDDKKAIPSSFDTMLKAAWSDRMRKGVFRYHLGDLQTRILPGPSRYVAQLNVKRGIERRKPEEILNIKQNYNPEQFNFNKIKPEEVIFEMTHHEQFNESELGRIMVIVNVSPLEFGHCLFIPEPSSCFPQVLTPSAIRTGIEALLLSSDPGFRVGFNSLGAFASVNHLHLHGYYLDHELQVECASVRPLIPEKGLYCLAHFPVGFLFYTEIDHLDNVVRAISQVTDYLLEGNQAHNLFFTRGCPPGDTHVGSRRGVRIVVWPRISCFGAKEESAFNVALCELAGHLPFKNKQDYDSSTEDEVKSIIQKYLIPHEEFLQLEKQLIAHLRMDLCP
ncbi:GDP-D-glucose phosphorylase 1 [Osmerus eperlanus]|uniref:GDP-D-glucose phosphorylase 1 n=1 Tax=Osmerus eperlanus TaxID=29151 RepID=UPI002E113BA3